MTDASPAAPPRAVLFDLDGTLVDTVPTRIEAWLAAFRERDIPADRDRVAELIGADGRHVARSVASLAGIELDDARAEELDRRAGERYGELNTDPRPLRGAAELLAWLTRRGTPWAIATSSRAEQVAASVEALRLAEPPVVIDGSHVERAKPEPDLLLAAASRLAAEPSATWSVGDSRWDITASRAAGMRAIGVTTGVTAARDLRDAGADLVVDSLDALLEYVDRAERSGQDRDGAPGIASLAPGFRVYASDGAKIGDVDAVFADYLLVRSGFPPVDVHVPTGAIERVHDERVEVAAHKSDVQAGIWDRPPMDPHRSGRRTAADDNPR